MSASASTSQRMILAALPAEGAPGRDQIGFAQAVVQIGRQCKAPVRIIALGPGAEAAAESAVTLGVSVTVITGVEWSFPPAPQELVAVMYDVVRLPEIGRERGPGLILFPSGALGEECAARLAARLDATALGRCTDIELLSDGCRVRRSAYGGRARVDLAVRGRTCVGTIRPDSNPIEANVGERGTVRTLRLPLRIEAAKPVHVQAQKTGDVRLEDQRVIVTGGRGMGSAEAFLALQALADRLDGAVGGSLPTIDAGWMPVSRQIGQSGKYVAPDVYVAVALSGTPQHLAGIDPRTRIVAINSDPDADIFQVAEVGALGDWREIVPRLIEALETVATGEDG